jgi:hypothetical protein
MTPTWLKILMGIGAGTAATVGALTAGTVPAILIGISAGVAALAGLYHPTPLQAAQGSPPSKGGTQ